MLFLFYLKRVHTVAYSCLDQHFPLHTKLKKIINKNTVKICYKYINKQQVSIRFSWKFLNRFLPFSTYGFYFERNAQRLSDWYDPSRPTKSLWKTLYCHRKWNVLVLRSQLLNSLNNISQQKIFCGTRRCFLRC